MEELEKRDHYIYRHRRLDDFSVFYVGLGSGKKYARARSKSGRITHWKNIVNKVGYKVEILADNLTKDEACELEILLIATYGREDLGLGRLVNLTDGGETNKGYVGDKVTYNKVFDTETNEIHRCVVDLANLIGINHRTLQAKLDGTVANDTKYILLKNWYEGYVHVIEESEGAKEVINVVTKEIFASIADAAKSIGMVYSLLSPKLNGRIKNNTDLQFLEDYNNGVPHNKQTYTFNKSKIRNRETGEIFKNLMSASKSEHCTWTRGHLGKMLRGDHPNYSPFEYYDEQEQINT